MVTVNKLFDEGLTTIKEVAIIYIIDDEYDITKIKNLNNLTLFIDKKYPNSRGSWGKSIRGWRFPYMLPNKRTPLR